MDDVIMAQVHSMEEMTGDVVERVAARREILRQEVLALEEKYALPPVEASPAIPSSSSVIPSPAEESKKKKL